MTQLSELYQYIRQYGPIDGPNILYQQKAQAAVGRAEIDTSYTNAVKHSMTAGIVDGVLHSHSVTQVAGLLNEAFQNHRLINLPRKTDAGHLAGV